MHVLVEVDHERDLTHQTDEAEVHQPPPVVGFDAEACSRGEKSAGRTGTRDPLVADESTADQSRQLILFLGRSRPKSDSPVALESQLKKMSASSHLPAKFP